MKWSKWSALAVLGVLLTAGTLPAANLYVTPGGTGAGTIADPASLQGALDAARVNGEPDTIYLEEGLYDAGPAGADGFEFDATLPGSDGLSVHLSGSWEFGFTYRDLVETVLDGGAASRVLLVKADATGASAPVSMDYIIVRNGKVTEPSHGGGILAWQGDGGTASLTVVNCIFEDNVGWEVYTDPNVDHSFGGAIAANCPLDISRTRFSRNRAYSGGAIYLWAEAAPAVVSGCTFNDNRTRMNWFQDPPGPYGGAGSAICSLSTELAVSGSDFRGMTDPTECTGNGGAIRLEAGAFAKITGTAFRDIWNRSWGAALDLVDASAEIVGCLFANNHAGGPPPGERGYGAISYLNATGDRETLTILDSTFVGNLGLRGVSHGAVYIRGGIAGIMNSIFWDNGTEALVCAAAPDPPDGAGTPCAASIDASLVQQGMSGARGFSYGFLNISLEPLFVAGDPDYRLEALSPGVDQGFNAAVPGGLETDFEGDPRIFGYLDRGVPLVDMGWDEFFDGVLTLDPAVGGDWPAGEPGMITWTCENIPGDVELSLWKGTGEAAVPVSTIAAAIPCSDGAYGWTMPVDTPEGTDYQVAIRSLAFPSVSDSVGGVAVRHLISVVSPNGGEQWSAGSSRMITWTSTDLAPGDLLEIRLEGHPGGYYPIAVDIPNTGYFLWAIPADVPAGSGYQIKIAKTSGTPLSADLSDATFSILAAGADLTLTTPIAGARWTQGSTYALRWTSAGLAGVPVTIELRDGAALVQTITAATPNDGAFSWKIPFTVPPGTTYRIRILAGGTAEDWTDAAFTILQALRVSAPNGGQLWKAGTAHAIKWYFKNKPGPYVRIDLLREGLPVRTITTRKAIGSSGRGSFLWTIPRLQLPAATYRIRVRSTANVNYADVSDADFTILKP